MRSNQDLLTELTEESGVIKLRISSLKEQLQSLKNRIENGANEVCPICYDNTENASIVPCCQNTFCLECIISWLDNKQSCPMCRQQLHPSQLNVLTEEPVCIETKPTKLDELMNIISTNDTGKFLIFSEYDNSFNEVKEYFETNNIEYNKLCGNSWVVTNSIKKFKDSSDRQILLLNAKHFGSGLNLHMTTDIIFYHRMSVDLERQVIGRGQRVGRTCPLKVHYLCYDNEM